MPSKPKTNNVRNQESNIPNGENSVRRDSRKSESEIYIGNIASDASKEEFLKFASDLNIISFRLFNKSNKVFGFADFQTVLEAETAIEKLDNKMFMKHKLVARFANSPSKKSDLLSQMPKLEDIDDDEDDDDDSREGAPDGDFKSGNRFEDSLNIQPDSSGLYSFCINRKDSFLKSRRVIEKIFYSYATLSSVSFTDDKIIVKMSSKRDAINSFRALGQELNMSIGDNSADEHTMKRNPETSPFKIYIGNINVKATKVKLIEFFDEVKITYCKLINKKNKVFAFANFHSLEEAEKAVELYNKKNFLGSKLVIRLADDRISAKKTESLPDMPKLEDIQDENCSESAFDLDDESSYHNEMISANMPELEDMNSEKNSVYKLRQSNRNHNNSRQSNRNYNNKSRESNHNNNNDKSAMRKVNDWISSQESIKENGLSTDVQDPDTLFVGNFPYETSEEQLLSLFKDFHAVNVNIINNNWPKRSTQALVNFPNKRESEKAIKKFDKCSYKGSVLLVTSTAVCPCHNKCESHKKNRVDHCNGSSSLDKGLERVDIFSHHAKQQQQKGRNCQAMNSSPSAVENKRSSFQSPSKTDRSRNKKMLEHNSQTEEDNQQIKTSQIDDPFRAEAAKMAILVKHFQIQPYIGSSSDIFQVMVTSVISNELFWGNVFSSTESDLTEFMVLHNELQSGALRWPKYILSKKEMKCVALYQDEWYRAWVLNSVERDVVEVFFLDYGNISRIHLNDVRSSEASLWKLPPKAKAFRIDSNSQRLPPNAENKFFDIKICKSGNMANGFISVASLVSH